MTKKFPAYRPILKLLSFIPALLMMWLIFSYSAQSGEASGSLSYTISYRIVLAKNTILQRDVSKEDTAKAAKRIEHPIRKLAHITEYFILTLAVSLPLYLYGLRGLRLMLIALLICIGFAATDEYHQSFVSGRGPSINDVIIDSIGVLLGVLVFRLLVKMIIARRNPRIKKGVL